MEPLRRAALTEPGEPLLISQSPSDAAVRLYSWTEYTGIPATANTTSALAAVPIPIYPQHWQGFDRRWATTNPAAMWHPLLWLPSRLAGRHTIIGDDGTSTVESDDLWVTRVAYELTDAGLYDVESGTWLDVLSTVDIDIDDPASQERVAHWLRGSGPDSVLDQIDLDSLLIQTPAYAVDPDWAYHQAAEEIDQLRVIAWATAAESLLDHATDLLDAPDEMPQGASLIADLAATAFAEIPTGGHHASTSESAWWSALADLITDEPRAQTRTTVEAIIGRLTELRDHYWPQLTQLAASAPTP